MTWVRPTARDRNRGGAYRRARCRSGGARSAASWCRAATSRVMCSGVVLMPMLARMASGPPVSRRTAGWAQNLPARTPMACSAASAAATRAGESPGRVKLAMPTRGPSWSHSRSSDSPGTVARPSRRAASSRCSWSRSAGQPMAVIASHAAASATAPIRLGVPASCRAGRSAHWT